VAPNRFVYDFDEPSDGGRELLGGKGIGLAEMTQLGVPVPAGFTITTDACRAYMATHDLLDGGHLVNLGSVAGRQAYENGATYIASKFAVRGFTYALREDLLGRPIRVTTVDAGLVETEFSLVRFGWDKEKADAVYDGLDPVTPDEIADCVLFALTRPLHVNVDEIVIKALAQSSGARVVRKESR